MDKPRRNTVWDQQTTALLVEHYPNMPMAQLGQLLEKTPEQIKNKAALLKLKRDESFKNSSLSGRLQPGHTQHNGLPVGEVRSDGRFNRLKLETGEWVAQHRWVWEQANGPIPDECVVVARDGNRCNAVLENLMLVSKNEHWRRNQLRKYPEDLRELILTHQDLKRVIREKKS